MVLCVDEKPQTQALERKAPVLPLRPGVPEKRSHDYVPARHHRAVRGAGGRDRQGDRRLLPAAPDQEFLAFLRQVARAYPRRKLHIVCDKYGTHNHPDVRAWLARHPRIP